MSDLTDQIKLVAVVREVAREAAEIKKTALDKWQAENMDMLSEVVATATKVGIAEDALRWLTLKTYTETGNKKPAKGVGVQQVTKYAYDGKEALTWAIKHEMALKLDDAKFKNHVKADPPDFVTITTEPRATIASDLSEFLK